LTSKRVLTFSHWRSPATPGETSLIPESGVRNAAIWDHLQRHYCHMDSKIQLTGQQLW
jgi:hypothetical protein